VCIYINGGSFFSVYLQLSDLMVHLEAGKTMEELSLSDEVKDGTVLPISIEASSSNDTKGGRKVNDEG
jgi:BRCA1-associated protein